MDRKSLTKRIHKRPSHCYFSDGRIIIEKGNEKFIVAKWGTCNVLHNYDGWLKIFIYYIHVSILSLGF